MLMLIVAVARDLRRDAQDHPFGDRLGLRGAARIRPVSASVCVVVLKNTSWVPTRMNAGSLFSAFTVGLAITFTLPWLANARQEPAKSFMFRPTVIAPLAVGADVLRERYGIAGALDQQLPVDAGRELVVQRDLDDHRLNLHLTRRAVVNGVEIELNLVEAIGKVGRLQQRGFPVDVESPFGRQECLHAHGEVRENIADVRGGHVSQLPVGSACRGSCRGRLRA